MTAKRPPMARIQTGVRNLDELLHGGLPRSSTIVIAGPPGSGKSILAQQICFHNASPENRILYFTTLSEPTAKTLRFLSQFSFFDPAKLDGDFHFVDLGILLRSDALEVTSKLVMTEVKKLQPALVVIDSFRVFDDLARSREELRKFGYELTVQLMAWETSVLVLGEYGVQDIATNPMFSIIDGLVQVSQREQAGEQQRFIQIVKMRGTEHSRDEHSFSISDAGIEIYAPRVTIKREEVGVTEARLTTGIAKLDDLLGDGIPHGSSLLIAGVSGTGKTVLLLEFLYRGAKAGEKGILFSFEETEARLRSNARGLGWDLDAEIERGMIEIVFVPQPNIQVEAHLLMMRERIEARQARRVAVDSVSVFLHKVNDPQLAREKIFQLASIIQNHEAVGFLATDIPYGTTQISRFGVEETVVDGVVVLTSTQEGLERHRYIEIYKLRNTAHLKGRHSMVIGPEGITVYPRYRAQPDLTDPAGSTVPLTRVPSGVAGLDQLVSGGLVERSATLISGPAGIGKSTLAIQFLVEGTRRGEPGLYVTLEEETHQILASAERLGLPLAEAVREGVAEVLYLSREQALVSQFLSRLVDLIVANKTRRLVLDSLTHLVPNGLREAELRQLLLALVARFKALGVTSLFTIESTSMYSSDKITDRAFSPIADNLVALRYAQLPGEIRPTLTVIKTRSTAHDFGTYFFEIRRGGLHIGGRAGQTPKTAVRARPARGQPRTKRRPKGGR
jgi:circadian clock protein KaiC